MARLTTIACLSLFLSASAWADPREAVRARQDAVLVLDRMVPELRFDNVPLEDAIDAVRQKAHANIVIRWDGFKEAGIEKTSKVKIQLWDIPVREAISVLIIAAAGGSADIDFSMEGAVLVVSNATFDPPNYDVRVFDVRDLLDAAVARRIQVEKVNAAAGPTTTPTATGSQASPPASEDEEGEKLIHLITTMVDHKTWDAPISPTIQIWNGRLFVKQSPAVQKHVEAFLEKIRESERGK